MRRRIIRLGAVFGLLLGAVAFGTAVSADIPIGVAVTTTDTKLCHTYEYGAVCIDASTASGGGAIFTLGTRTGRFFGDAFTADFGIHIHLLLPAGTTQEGSSDIQVPEKINGRDYCFSYQYRYQFHDRESTIRFADFSVTPNVCARPTFPALPPIDTNAKTRTYLNDILPALMFHALVTALNVPTNT